MTRVYANRAEAGRLLAGHLESYKSKPRIIMLGLPRGGVPVAAEIARSLRGDLDVHVVRKLGVPGHEELAMGAIASGGVLLLNQAVVDAYHVRAEELRDAVRREEEELARREQSYRGDWPPPQLEGRTVVLVDDGLATGASMRAAVRSVRRAHPLEVVVAVPVAPKEAVDDLAGEADRVVAAQTPWPFEAVGAWYIDFRAPTTEEIRRLLGAVRRDQ